MKNAIINKQCFVKNGYGCFCSKCGKKQLQDHYNLEKHARECGFTKNAIIEMLSTEIDYVYAFKISKDGERLNFYVYTPSMKLCVGWKDRYSGAEWKEVFKATFYKGSKEIKENGLYNIDIWMKKMLDKNHIHRLSYDEDVEIFRHFFTDVVAFDSYGSFLDI